MMNCPFFVWALLGDVYQERLSVNVRAMKNFSSSLFFLKHNEYARSNLPTRMDLFATQRLNKVLSSPSERFILCSSFFGLFNSFPSSSIGPKIPFFCGPLSIKPLAPHGYQYATPASSQGVRPRIIRGPADEIPQPGFFSLPRLPRRVGDRVTCVKTPRNRIPKTRIPKYGLSHTRGKGQLPLFINLWTHSLVYFLAAIFELLLVHLTIFKSRPHLASRASLERSCMIVYTRVSVMTKGGADVNGKPFV